MLHPQAQALIDLLIERKVPPTHTLTPADARKLYRERRAVTQPAPGEVAEVRELNAPGPHGAIPLRYYRPLGSASAAVLPVLVYYHGGGWTIGDLDTHDTLCRELCNLSGCALVAVDYRMGPEHRFPAAVDDALAATRWVHDQASALGVDASRLAVGGDSAGGNLAAVVALHARDAGGPPLCFQLLIYPATDQNLETDSLRRNGEGYLLTRALMEKFRSYYLPRPADYADWRASPALAKSHADLPPAFVLTAGFDPLLDEGRQYVELLARAGVEVAYRDYPDMVHGFIVMGGVLDTANAAVADCCAALRRAFDKVLA
jgi:acetyl esterase